MVERIVDEFFELRKEDRLKKKSTPGMPDAELAVIREACEVEFAPGNWLPNAAKRADQMSIASHPCTFSHPSARKNKNGSVTPVVARVPRSADGLVRSGNVDVELDALGSAAALDVYKFLSLVLDDGMSIIDHLQEDTERVRSLLTIESEPYDSLRTKFLKITAGAGAQQITSSKIKQVYFPINKGYHLLSVLSNSGMIYELRKRLDSLRFSEEVVTGRQKRRENEYSQVGFSEIFDLTTIAYGGTKPQNISVLNNQNGGKAHLLLSVPPSLEKRDLQFPTRDFFVQSIRYQDCSASLKPLHGILRTGESDIPRRNLETGRDKRLDGIVQEILERMNAARSVSATQYREESSSLPGYQKIWLVESESNKRDSEDGWLDELCEAIARWISRAYQNIARDPVAIGPAERAYLLTFVQLYKGEFR